MLVAAVLRLYDLDLVPLHHDEGVNGNFLTRLVREGIYRYDPENYHGPTIYYFSAFIPWILRFLLGTAAQDKYGLNTIYHSLSTGIVWVGNRLAGAAAAAPPGFSRNSCRSACYSPSSPGAFICLAITFMKHYSSSSHLVWLSPLWYYEEAHPIYLVLASISALLFATKETAIISAGVLVIALAVTQAYRFIRRRDLQNRQANKRSSRTAAGAGNCRGWIISAGR